MAGIPPRPPLFYSQDLGVPYSDILHVLHSGGNMPMGKIKL